MHFRALKHLNTHSRINNNAPFIKQFFFSKPYNIYASTNTIAVSNQDAHVLHTAHKVVSPNYGSLYSVENI